MIRRQTGILFLLLVSACAELAPGTAAIPGDEKAFDVIANFSKIAAHAGQDAKLIELEVQYVPTSGLLDLTQQYKPNVKTKFVAKASQADVDGQGPRAPGSGFKLGDLINVEVDVQVPSRTSEWTERNLGMERTSGSLYSSSDDYVEAPKCAFGQLWKDAIAKGAPTDVVAIIEYDKAGYKFKANGKNFEASFDMGCKIGEVPKN